MSTIKAHPTIKDLQRMGYPVTPGNEYFPKSWIPKKAPSLKRVQKILSQFKGSMAELICQIRDEE